VRHERDLAEAARALVDLQQLVERRLAALRPAATTAPPSKVSWKRSISCPWYDSGLELAMTPSTRRAWGP
jgi:hypothetical protein